MGKKKRKKARHNGDTLLYQLFKDMLTENPVQARAFAKAIIEKASIWFRPDAYKQMPVLLPWVVRDNSCRGKKRTKRRAGKPNMWGAPNHLGYQRDDNSMVKGLVGSLAIHGPDGSKLHGKRLGKGYVASHIWMEVNQKTKKANKLARLNSFIPNLVWLPTEVSWISNLDGHHFQSLLKAVSKRLYRRVKVQRGARTIANANWKILGTNRTRSNLASGINLANLHFFDTPSDFIRKRRRAVTKITGVLRSALTGDRIERSAATTRYRKGIRRVSADNLRRLLKEIAPFGER